MKRGGAQFEQADGIIYSIAILLTWVCIAYNWTTVISEHSTVLPMCAGCLYTVNLCMLHI